MLYNITAKREWMQLDCISCPFFDNRIKECQGLGKKCFEYDPLTKTVIDPITKLPIKA